MKRLSEKPMDKKAFTLIEVLVVIIIVGAILAILFPAVGKAKEGARRAQCVNNLRQHGIAWYLYLDDHNQAFPGYSLKTTSDIYCSPISFEGKARFNGLRPANSRPLNRYLEIYDETSPNINIFHCPDDINPNFNSSYKMNNFDWDGCSYRFNHLGNSNISLDNPPFPLSGIKVPMDKLHMEMCLSSNDPGHGGHVYPRIPVMVLFVDGHVGGPFMYDEDFEWGGGDKVLCKADGGN